MTNDVKRLFQKFNNCDWDKEWEKAEKRTSSERLISLFRIARRMKFYTDSVELVKAFLRYHFVDKHCVKKRKKLQ
jgi:hypothetical protein